MMNDRFKFRAWDNDNECFNYLDFNDLEKAKRTIDNYSEYFWNEFLKNLTNKKENCKGLNND